MFLKVFNRQITWICSPMQANNPIPDMLCGKVINGDATSPSITNKLPDNSVHLMVTSPPYGVGKEYDDDLVHDDFMAMLKIVWRDVYRVLIPGGRACINVANIGRKPYIPFHADIIRDMLDIGFIMRGEIIWDKGASAGSSTAWGSWCSPSNPCLRDQHEYILLFSKGRYDRPDHGGKWGTITKNEFTEYTRSVWRMDTESAKRINHPAPYPVELPYRLIQLYTYNNDVVFDPFMGSGTTGVAAKRLGREFVGYERDSGYCDIARQRIASVNGDLFA